MSRLATVIVGFLLLCAIGHQARATILFAGGEDTDFICNIGGTCSVDTNANYFRAAWARASYVVGGTTNDPPANRFATPTFAANANIWVHAQFCLNGGITGVCGTNSSTANAQMVRVIDNAGNPTLIIRGTGAAGELKISSRTAGGTFTDLATCSTAFSTGKLVQLDLQINYGASGQVALYSNSVSVCNYSGNVTNGDGAPTLNALEFASPLSGSAGEWSELIVATTDTRAMNLYTLAPNDNGFATQWSNSSGTTPCVSLLGQISIQDTNYVFSATNNQIEECAVRNSIPAGAYNALALVMSGRLLAGASGPLHFDFVTRIGTTDYLSADFAPTNSFSNFNNYIQSTNPATSASWSTNDFIASGNAFNIGLKSKP